jgi:aminoglycoside/choline kinase family phosphotransferase
MTANISINTEIKEHIIKNFSRIFDDHVINIKPLAAHGSNRRYFRITGGSLNCIAAYNNDYDENLSFISLTKHFSQKRLPVPKLYAEILDRNIYFLEDLGDTTLYDYLLENKIDGRLSPKVFELYKKVLSILPRFQIDGARDLDFSICYPREAFDKQSMMWDLNYFKYYFLKFKNIPFNEQQLEDDFHTFTDFLLNADQHYFLYRDFQSRNIMIKEDKLYFIDYQGGRRGAYYYDAASLLYDAKANLTEEERGNLLEIYMENLAEYFPLDKKKFLQYYYGYVLMRIMQAFGAYGFRGYYERKEHFIKSVPFAVKNLKYLLNNVNLPVNVPMLYHTWQEIIKL